MDITLDPGKTEWSLKVLSYSLILPLVLSLQTESIKILSNAKTTHKLHLPRPVSLFHYPTIPY